MRRAVAQRQAGLAGIALLGVAGSLAVTTKSRPHAAALPPAQGSYTALAAGSAAFTPGTTSSCGFRIRAATEGVANPVLPCGMRLYVSYHGRSVLTRVIGGGPETGTVELGLTKALARRLGLSGRRRIRWSYAGPG